jgi:hypothetical protein
MDGRHTDKKNLTVAFRNSANAPKKRETRHRQSPREMSSINSSLTEIHTCLGQQEGRQRAVRTPEPGEIILDEFNEHLETRMQGT